MVRNGNTGDLDAVVVMAEQFWQHTIYDVPFDPIHVRNMAALAMDHGLLAILEVGGKVEGFAAGVKGPLLGNASVLSGSEIAWWVNPAARKGRNGIALLQHIEQMARDQGIVYWNMMYMESSMPALVERIYGRLGYKKAETSYTRKL